MARYSDREHKPHEISKSMYVDFFAFITSTGEDPFDYDVFRAAYHSESPRYCLPP